ncbi:MAG: hypothetical protein Q7K28_01280 [Candidatus Wildermuthbacteria bacterium]|nr:hypothetical protein [Candidatus Wildermuthbacteria bacterium]
MGVMEVKKVPGSEEEGGSFTVIMTQKQILQLLDGDEDGDDPVLSIQ